MRLINLWSFARDFISKKYLIYIVSVVMCVLAMLLFSAGLFAYQVTRYGKKQCEELFTKGVDGTGVFRFDTNSKKVDENFFDNLYDFIEAAGQMEEIYAIGSYVVCGGFIPGGTELIQIQKEFAPEVYSLGYPEDKLVYLPMNKEAINLFDWKLQSGEIMESDGDIHYVYLGAAYSSIEVGTAFRDEDGVCVVAGIFEKGACIVDSGILFGESDTLELNYTINLDNMIVYGDSGAGSNWITFSVNDGYTVEDGIRAIESVGEQYDAEITWASCESVLYRRDVKNERIISTTRNMIIWLVVVIFIIMLCIQVSDSIERSGEFGILYANGSSTRDICGIVVMENVRRAAVGFVLWLAIAFIICKTIVIPYYKQDIYHVDDGIIMDIFLRGIIPWVAVFALCYICVMSIVPFIMARRQQPIKLIEGFKA